MDRGLALKLHRWTEAQQEQCIVLGLLKGSALIDGLGAICLRNALFVRLSLPTGMNASTLTATDAYPWETTSLDFRMHVAREVDDKMEAIPVVFSGKNSALLPDRLRRSVVLDENVKNKTVTASRMAALFFRQFVALFWKNWIILYKHKFANLVSCLFAPIGFGVFLALAQTFLSKPNNYGMGTPAPVYNFTTQYDGSLSTHMV
ncbi:hypothetical protein BU15DRAFT_78327 [Melanogaster broomeanus]|nr:hypothetical protein BU15DRAFT_78327 [Melanogaster broomeanus]